MLLRVLKSNSLYNNIFIAIIAIALSILTFSHHAESALTPSGTLFPQIFEVSSLINGILSILLMGIYILLLWQINYRFMLVKGSSFVLVTLGLVLLYSDGSLLRYNPESMASIFLLLIAYQLFQISDKTSDLRRVFDISLLCSIASLIHIGFSVFIIIIPFSILIMRKIGLWRDFVIPLFVFSSVWLSAFSVFVFTDSTDILIHQIEYALTQTSFPVLHTADYIFIGFIGFLILLGSLHIVKVYDTMKIHQRRCFKVFFLFFIVSCTLGLLPLSVNNLLILVIPSLVFLLTNYLVTPRWRIFKEILFILLIIISILKNFI